MSAPQRSHAQTVAALKNMMFASTAAMRGMTTTMDQALHLIGEPDDGVHPCQPVQLVQPDDAVASDAATVAQEEPVAIVQQATVDQVAEAVQEDAEQQEVAPVEQVAVPETVPKVTTRKRRMAPTDKVVQRKRVKQSTTEPEFDYDAAHHTFPMVITKKLILESLGTPVLDRPGFRAIWSGRHYHYNAGFRVKRWVNGGAQVITLEIVDNGGERPEFHITAPFLEKPIVHKSPSGAYQAFATMFNKGASRRSGQDMLGLNHWQVCRMLEASVRRAENAAGVVAGGGAANAEGDA